MTALADLQHGFQRYLLRGEPGVIARIGGAEGIDLQRRMRIYFDAYRLRLVEALATDYEALRALLGREQFNDACCAYVEATPSLFRNVRWYGGGLAEFLRTTPPWAHQPVAYELALFEWTLTLAFDAAELPTARFLFAFGPTWSPDGSRLAFSSQTGVLFTVAPDGSDLAKVPGSSGGEVSVRWGVASQ